MNAKRVLVVDDDDIGRMLIGRYLLKAGHASVMASDGKVAWELLDGGAKFDLIISDNQMPHLNGLELLKLVRADSRMADTPFALASGSEVAADSSRLDLVCNELRASFISKPFVGLAAQLAVLLDEKANQAAFVAV